MPSFILLLKKILFLSALLFFSIAFAKNTFAANQPTFFSCLNPEGTVIASYSNGVHAVVGDQSIKNGSDTVYLIGNSNYMQCLCEESGQGTQTNWWKIGRLSQNEIENYEKQGWHYVADGSEWGLENSSYLAKNEYYICGQLGRGGGEVLGTGGGEILGFASTGGKNLNFYFLLGGLTTINFGLYLFQNQNS